MVNIWPNMIVPCLLSCSSCCLLSGEGKKPAYLWVSPCLGAVWSWGYQNPCMNHKVLEVATKLSPYFLVKPTRGPCSFAAQTQVAMGCGAPTYLLLLCAQALGFRPHFRLPPLELPPTSAQAHTATGINDTFWAWVHWFQNKGLQNFPLCFSRK